MRSSPNPIYRLLHKDYPETFAAYSPQTTDFYDLVFSQLPEGWGIQRRDMWFYCSPSRQTLPLQGWKIHVSAALSNSANIVRKVASVLVKYNDVSFKFAVDRSILSLFNSKGWPRGASGKFITIYPSDSHRFLELIEEIDQATAGMRGPYILSDHRYKTSRVVFYRYGGIRAHTILNIKGEKIPVLKGPDGSVVPDQRLPYPIIPAWETPVIPVQNSDRSSEPVELLHGRYRIEAAISFSSAGGVYVAHDIETGKRVVVKEARPCINAAADDYDAVELLKKEYRLLNVLAGTGIVPQPVDLFQEWEHWFLVEEFIEGIAMSRHSATHNILLRTRPTEDDSNEWRLTFSRLAKNLVKIVRILHSRKIVFADLSTNNLIVTADGRLKIIDFEGAHELGVDRPANIYTPGFGSQHRVAGGAAEMDDDYYSAGAVLLAYLLPVNGLLHLNPQARHELISSIRNDVQLPEGLPDLISTLMDEPQSDSAPSPKVEVLTPLGQRDCDNAAQRTSGDYQAVLDDIVMHLNGVAEYKRKDRLYPADPRIFSTNPLSLAYGAAGVTYALYKIAGTVPQAAVDWILQHRITSTEYAPGLYQGMAGIAWSLLEMGMREPAEEIFQSTFQHPLVSQSADLFHGMAGWGMAALRFFQTTGKEEYLKQAERAGSELIASCKKSDRGYYWISSEGYPLGLAHGSSGVGLFLLYLHLITKNEHYLAAGLQALDFDLAAGTRTKDGGLSWSENAESASSLYPYWRFGSAGIGMATIRFQRLVGSPRYESILEQIFVDTDRKYAVFPGRFAGLAGLGEFLLDMHDLSGERRFLESANKVAEGIMHFRVKRNGTAFPGELSSRLCCDYGTGSAGIALFLNRLMGKQKSDFMLDELFGCSPGQAEHVKHHTKAMAQCAPARMGALSV
ncbi:MAG: class III lanthionine synthetase LanKC [Acidobacteriia bacterium]|nr:class III lanthionine synthetase LanKC [Terriglobia bacterium]